MVTERNHTVDFLKCICIIAVVLHHCSNRRLLPEVREIFTYTAYLTDWCVIGFIGLSGFLEGRRTVAGEDWRAYVNRDCKRLLNGGSGLCDRFCSKISVLTGFPMMP
jgi:hypothetical protein